MFDVPDLTPFPKFGQKASSLLTSIAWVSRGLRPSMGAVPRDVYDRLCLLVRTPWERLPPLHALNCPVCVFHPEMTGKRLVVIPGQGTLYVCPDLITHFVNAHGYTPPEVFCDAVLNSPLPTDASFNDAIMNQGGREFLSILAESVAA